MYDTNIAQNTQSLPAGRELLRELYKEAPKELYFEIRCIHPTSGQVRSLWARMDDGESKKRILAEAERHNKEGYSIYFAPCLRRERKGSAESAAYISALWVDVDGKDERSLRKLNDFTQPPSAIVDSGGGYHAYWFLSESLCLDTDEQKQHIASIMIGLFSVTGGDEAYVKSVASVMRLPDSINTKPDRESAKVHLVAWHPERRYKLSEFEWLSKPKEEIIDGLKVITLNGHGALPPRTEQYLMTGASKSNRNAELFAAACQMRDAGHSQSDTERQLIPRYVADAVGGESANQREKEARATIESVYSQPARDPIITAKERVSALVSNLQSQPAIAQIRETVQACAHLDPLEWAEQRGKLKAVCGDGLKVADLDKMHREAQKTLVKQQVSSFIESERYLETDGKLIFQRLTAKGTFDKVVCEWTAKILEVVARVDDDGEQEQITNVQLQRGDYARTIPIPSDVFGDDAALRRFIARKAGVEFTVRAGMGKHLTPAIVKLSGDYSRRTAYRFMGWAQIGGQWAYITPGACIGAEGRHEVELEPRLRDYGLKSVDWDKSLEAFRAMVAVFPPELAPTLIAFACLPLFQRFFPSAAMKFALHLVGTTGSGKSEIASLMMGLYGDFSRDAPPAQWGDTINTVEVLGNAIADALYWVDDYKDIYADTKTFARFMQSYSRNMGRGRLTREAKLRQEKPCRGHIISTGETSLEGEASIYARMMSLDIPTWEKRDPSGRALTRANELREFLSGFTFHLARWIVAQDADELSQSVAARFVACADGYERKLDADGVNSLNARRVVGNWAMLTTVYQLLGKFLIDMDADYTLPMWQDRLIQNAQAMQEERAAFIALDIIAQLKASGQLAFLPIRNAPTPAPGVTVGGYQDGEWMYLLPDVVCQAVNRVHPLQFSPTAIGKQLNEEGILVAGNSANHLTVQIRVNGGRVRVWRLKASVLLDDDDE